MDRIEESIKRILEYASLQRALNQTNYSPSDLIKEDLDVYKLGKDEISLWNEAVIESVRTDPQRRPFPFNPPLSHVFYSNYPRGVLDAHTKIALRGGLLNMLEAFDAGVPAADIIA